MNPLFAAGFTCNTSGFITRLVVIPLACIISFAFYQVGVGLGSSVSVSTIATIRNRPEEFKSYLRSKRTSIPKSANGIPECARSVFFTLNKEIGGEDDHSCKGLLIRDDIILTSKECSKFNFTFDYEAAGVVRAVPHISLNSKSETVDSPLGFLEASMPYHYIFNDQPVRRTRLFLSHRSPPSSRFNGIGFQKAVFLTCGDQKEPIAHSFPVSKKMVPLGHLAGVVPGDILWEETDINLAIMLGHESDLWWSRPITLKMEEKTIKNMFAQWQGPPGSVSLTGTPDLFTEKAGALFEAVDPRGHRYRKQHCFKNYYIRYQSEKPFSGAHFFDWLDFGHGTLLPEKNTKKKISYMKGDEYCYKKSFDKPKNMVNYFTDDERFMHKVYIQPSKDGNKLIARYRHNNETVPISDEDDPHLYVWDLNETFYIVDDVWDEKRYGTIEVKHSSVLAGRPALSAGKVYLGKHGAISGINFDSGHYYPDIQSLSIMYQWMKNQGFNVSALHWIGRGEWFEYKGGGSDTTISTRLSECNKYDWESVKIPGYNAAQLNQSCCEVTVSPTWEFC